MEIHGRYRAPDTPRDARELQERLRDRVIRTGDVAPRVVAGVDVSEKDGVARAAIVVTRGLEPIEEISTEQPIAFPYVPGLLSFRELPPLLSAWKKLQTRPDVVIVDGQGYAHPRRFGLACHFGILVDLPTIGCAKSRLIGAYDEPAAERGSWSPLVDREETVGAALRTQDGRNVVYVSTGHRISLASAIRVILACAPKYRLPEPQRLADRLSKQELVR
jgi:deoxyribonuclease V